MEPDSRDRSSAPPDAETARGAQGEDRAQRDQLLEAVAGSSGSTLGAELARQIRTLPAAALADLIEASPAQSRLAIWRCADAWGRGESLIAVHGDVRSQLLAGATDAELLTALEHLQLDELADLDAELPGAVLGDLLESMSAVQRSQFDTVRSFPDDSAGGLMDVDALAVAAHLSLREVQDQLRHVRERDGALPEHIDSIFVVGDRRQYVGRLLLADVISLPPETAVGEALRDDIVPIDAELSADAVARRFEDDDLMSAPVIGHDGHLLGRITIDDVVDVIRGEGENAVLGMAGLDRDVDAFGGIGTAVRRRLLWIGIHLANGLIAAGVIGLFRDSIEALVALAVLMPIVAGVGGVGGTQSLALVMRGLALEHIGPANAPRLFAAELTVALVNGLLWSLVIATIVDVWFGDLGLALVFAAALTFNLVNGAFFGTWLPLALPKLGVDPAVAGSVLLVAATDVLGFLVFLSLATLLLL